MINRKIKLFFVVITLILLVFATSNCENPVIKKWWVDPEPQEPFYIPITKYIPEVFYEEIIQHDIVYEKLPPEIIVQQLPPEIVIQYVPKYIYETVYEKIYEEIIRDPTDDEIKEIIKQLPPEFIIQYLTEQQVEEIIKLIPPTVIIQYVPEYIYETEYETIYEYIYETEYETIYETITVTRPPTEEEIKEIIKQLPPEYIFEFLTDEQIQYIKDLLTEEVYLTLPPKEIIIHVPEYIYETEYKTIYEEIIKEVEPDPEEFIKKLPPEIIFKYLTDDQLEYIYEQLPPKLIYEQLPPEVIIQTETVYEYIYETKYETIIQEIMIPPNEDEIKEIIKQLPPEIIFEYLTTEQIKYIKEQIPPEVIVQQLPPQLFLQYITIVDIEFVVFAGDAETFNGPAGAAYPGGAIKPGSVNGTQLTAQEKSSNNAIVAAMADELKKHPEYMLILHGHANPVLNTPAEALELEIISNNRASAVEDEIIRVYSGDSSALDNRITTRGYGSEHTISVPDATSYAGLNRRVEVILITVNTTPVTPPGGEGGG